MVTVKLFGETLRQSLDEAEYQLELAAPTTVRGLLQAHAERLSPLVTFLEKGELLVTVNRRVATQDSRVKDGDEVKLTHQVHPDFDGARWHNP
jgi:molybdopterin converting factor small subunit